MTSIVRGTALLGFDAFATSQGLDPHAVLAEIGIPGDALDDVIDYAKFNALLELCAKRSANQLFGLQLGLHQGSQVLGNLLYLIQSARTFGEALKALTENLHAHSRGAEVHLERQGESALLSYDVTDGDAASVRQDVELAMGVGAHLMQGLLGRPWRPKALLVRYPAVVEPSAYRRLLGVTPRFDSPLNAWVFDSSLLDTPLSAADERLQQLVQHHIDDLTQITLRELPFYVQKLLRDRLPNGHVTIEQVAEYLKISPRTLQRYLMAEDTCFQALLDKTRQSMATRYICDSSISLTQLSGLLGYSDLSAFSRAFSRWNGVSPRKWKQRYLQAQTH
ncbi:AraC family transcriptional regulator [Pseudomonas alcaligenes]|uniref:AraC family transcriptional regulator n=1 Tax=Aquipseudomonas alcaligenes TaxID=43263 RepID=A0ABR7S052_AQUAC|nr:AraC family transcriptional regulator [Pseudomonas alcaligenes]MBC9250960.1 AraC family transcriptional regulator [Pseudomonas alcaligenes]